MRKSSIIALIVFLLMPFMVIAMQYNQSLNPGDSIVVSGVGDGTLTVVQNGNSATLSFAANPTPTPTPSGTADGIWMSRAEVQALPMTGTAWDNVKSKALGSWGSANLKDLNSTHDVLTLAGALYYARTNDSAMRTKVANAIMSSIGTEVGGRALEPSRNIVSYVIAADLIDLQSYDSAKNTQFRNFISALRTEVLDGRTIISTHNERPNNWGTHAGAARVAIDRYLGDTTDLALACVS